MSECPICETEGYKWRDGCEECGHYDEDRIRLEKRHLENERRRIRRDRRF